MSDNAKQSQRLDRHAREIEEGQEQMRKSIAETERLVGKSEKMLRRHRKEHEDDAP